MQTTTQTIVLPLAQAIHDDWVAHPQTTFVKKHLAARISYAFLIPLTVVTSITDIAMGTVGAFAAILTGGSHEPTYMFAGVFLNKGSMFILTQPYRHLLHAIDPGTSIDIQIPFHRLMIVWEGGLVAGRIDRKIERTAQNTRASNVFLTRHVATRGLHLLRIPVSLITRVADLAIGLIAAVFSILTLGQITAINQIAYGGLLAPLMLRDLFSATVHVINPWVIA